MVNGNVLIFLDWNIEWVVRKDMKKYRKTIRKRKIYSDLVRKIL